MSTHEPDRLEFRGKDLKECEEFIAAVNKYARVEGKLRDEQWIADLVATCVAGDALLWWSGLGEETQGSWKLLRSAMLLRYRLLFAGRSGAEAEAFVLWVRQRALDLGKLDDVLWTAKFASGCFAGSALRWYISLESGVRDDWVSLQWAIFAQYGQQFEEGSSIVPTPAPATVASIASTSRRRGRIRVFREGDSETYYLSKALGIASGQPGRLHATTSVADALVVECGSLRASDGPQNLLIPDNQLPGFDVLGLKWYAADRTADDNRLAICGVTSTSGAATLGSPFDGPILVKTWNVAQSEDRRITISALCSEFGDRLRFFSGKGGNRWLWFRLKKYLPTDWDSELLFEPI